MPAVLGHATLKNDEVNQTEWWVAQQRLWSKAAKEEGERGRGPERVADLAFGSRGFYGFVGRLF